MEHKNPFTYVFITVLPALVDKEVRCVDSSQPSSGSTSPDNDLESSRLLSGSYTILNGEIRLSKVSSANHGDLEEPALHKKIPPRVPPKPNKPAAGYVHRSY